MSAKVPPTLVIGAEEAIPAKAREAIKQPIFGASAEGKVKTSIESIVRPRIFRTEIGRTEVQAHAKAIHWIPPNNFRHGSKNKWA